MRLLALDISTKTGWACLTSGPDGLTLGQYGQLEQMPEPKGVSYPISYVNWAEAIFDEIKSMIQRFKPQLLVIEETAAGSKSNFSQKILEFIHFLVASFIKETQIPVQYFLTEEWRRVCGCKMTKEESKHNKEVRDYKKKTGKKLAKNKAGKVIGKIGRKHVNVRRANEIFVGQLERPLQKKDEDTADALLLGAAYHFRNNLPTKSETLKGLRETA